MFVRTKSSTGPSSVLIDPAPCLLLLCHTWRVSLSLNISSAISNHYWSCVTERETWMKHGIVKCIYISLIWNNLCVWSYARSYSWMFTKPVHYRPRLKHSNASLCHTLLTCGKISGTAWHLWHLMMKHARHFIWGKWEHPLGSIYIGTPLGH